MLIQAQVFLELNVPKRSALHFSLEYIKVGLARLSIVKTYPLVVMKTMRANQGAVLDLSRGCGCRSLILDGYVLEAGTRRQEPWVIFSIALRGAIRVVA